MIKPHRVVITGIGMVTPIGVGRHDNWANILKGKNGIVSLSGEPEFKGLKS